MFAIHDTLESVETFRDTVLMPTLVKGIEGGFTTAPEETIIEIDRIMP